MANDFLTAVESLFKGMDGFITTKTVVGDAVRFEDGTIILPLVDVSFGVAAGAFGENAKNRAAGGMGGKITPSSVLVIQNGNARIVSVKNQDSVSKILDMVPEVLDKFKKDDKTKQAEKETDEKAIEIAKETAKKKEKKNEK